MVTSNELLISWSMLSYCRTEVISLNAWYVDVAICNVNVLFGEDYRVGKELFGDGRVEVFDIKYGEGVLVFQCAVYVGEPVFCLIVVLMFSRICLLIRPISLFGWKTTKIEFFLIFFLKSMWKSHNIYTQDNWKYLISSEKWEGVKIYYYYYYYSRGC